MAFQTFDPPAVSAAAIADRIAALRGRFDELGIDALVIPHEDAFQSEYLPPAEERLAAATGFTGSAGQAIVLTDRALLATDGRYTLQARRQAPELFEVVTTKEALDAWRKEHLAGLRVGIDPALHSRKTVESLERAADGITLVRLSPHPLDAIWTDRPAPPRAPVRAHPAAFAGESAADKLARVRAELADGPADALLCAAADDTSWLFNLRGGDVAHTPLTLARAFVPREGRPTLFIAPGKLIAPLADEVAALADIVDEADTADALTRLAAGRTVRADPARTSDALLAAIEAGGTLSTGDDPVMALKAVKNAAEIAGMRAAHVRDGRAMVRFLAWLDAHAAGADEIRLAQTLEAFRREEGAIDLSFDTISGAGEHGAIVHYRVDESTNRSIAPDDPILIDSGGQYGDGTTDVTRTVVAGTPSASFVTAFTLVLKGFIAVSRARLPVGAWGAELDPMARQALWRAGHDYKHGTGHGVGAALAVHEGPPGIGRRYRTALKPGMIVSNEPGHYREGGFGIRTETLCLVTAPRAVPGGSEPMMALETLTLVPIDTRLVARHMLNADEIGWLDSYHARVRGALAGDFDPATEAWLTARTRPLG